MRLTLKVSIFRILHTLTCLGLTLSATTLLAAEIRVLTDDAGTSSTGQWGAATGASMRFDGLPGLYAISGSGATYTFSPNLPLTTTYAVEAFNNCYSPRAHNVTYVIQHAGGTSTFSLEQDCSLDSFVGTWRPLGTFQFNAGKSIIPYYSYGY